MRRFRADIGSSDRRATVGRPGLLGAIAAALLVGGCTFDSSGGVHWTRRDDDRALPGDDGLLWNGHRAESRQVVPAPNGAADRILH